MHQKIKQRYRKRHQEEEQRFCDSKANAAAAAAAAPNPGRGGRQFVAKHTYDKNVMNFLSLVFAKSSFRADSTLSKQIKCINPKHNDKKPSMRISLIPRFWEQSDKITVDENTARILDTILGVDRNDNVKEGEHYTSVSDNVVSIGDKVYVIYVFSVYCFACGFSAFITTK